MSIIKTFYIAGKISDLPIEVYETNFRKAGHQLKAMGHEFINPVRLHDACTHEKEWLPFMRCDLTALLSCNGVYALNNWAESKGATIEVNLAISLGLEIIYQDEKMCGECWLTSGPDNSPKCKCLNKAALCNTDSSHEVVVLKPKSIGYKNGTTSIEIKPFENDFKKAIIKISTGATDCQMTFYADNDLIKKIVDNLNQYL